MTRVLRWICGEVIQLRLAEFLETEMSRPSPWLGSDTGALKLDARIVIFKNPKQSAALVARAADCKLWLGLAGLFAHGKACSCCWLLFHHGAAAQNASRRIRPNILKLVTASTDHEMAAMLTPSYRGKVQATSTIRIYRIGSGYILIEVGIGYVATTEVQNTASRQAACAIERI